MRHLALAVLLLLAAPAQATEYALTIEVGYAGPVEFEFGEDVSAATGTWVVYQRGAAPNSANGIVGTPLFTVALGAGSSSTRLRATLTALQTAAAGSYYMVGTRVMGGVTFPWHGTLVVSGR